MLSAEASRGSICVTVSNFVAIGQTVAEVWRFSKMAAVRHLRFVVQLDTHEWHLVVFITMHNFVGIYTVVSIIRKLKYFAI